jgi:hypothetical protein
VSSFSHDDPFVAPANIRERAEAIEKGDMRMFVSDGQAARIEKRRKEKFERFAALQEFDMVELVNSTLFRYGLDTNVILYVMQKTTACCLLSRSGKRVLAGSRPN